MDGRRGAQVFSYLGGGHETFNGAVMKVSAYMVSWQSATLWSPTSPSVSVGSMTKCLMSVKEMKSDGGRG